MDLLEKMTTFTRVVDTGSITLAARQRRLSVPAVSRQLSTLEGTLKVKLLSRTTRRLAVTPEGQLFYERCQRVFREVEEARAVGKHGRVEGDLTVSAPVTFGLAAIGPHVHDFRVKHPGVRLELRLEDALIDLVFAGVDVAIRVGAPPPDSTELVAQKLASFRRVLVASPSYLRHHAAPRTPSELTEHIALVPTAPANMTLTNGEQTVVARPQVGVRCTVMHVLRELALAGDGIATLPEFLVREDLARRSLRRVLRGWATPPIEVHAIFRVGLRGAPGLRSFVEFLRERFAATGFDDRF